MGEWNVGLRASYENPDNIRNFYGLGNETQPSESLDSTRIRLGELRVAVPFTRRTDTGLTFEVAPVVARTDLADDQPLPDSLQQPGLSTLTTEPQWYAGLGLELDLRYLDDPTNPRQGYRWTTSADLATGVAGTPDDFAGLETDFALYTSLHTRRQATLGVRVGGAHTFGTFPFFYANALGGQTNLRGYRSTRFSGRSSLYANTEARVGLFDLGGSLLPGTMGAVGFFDIGRVWTDGESSNQWHSGYGGGLWYDIAGELVIRLTGGWSGEDSALLFGAGFFF